MILQEVLRRRFRILNRETMDQERSIDVFFDIINFLRKYLRPVGMDILEKEYRWNWRTSLCAMNLVCYFVLLMYTIHLNWGQWILVLESCSITGIAFQGIIKMHDGIKHIVFFNEQYQKLVNLHERNSTHKENNRVLVFCCVLIHYIFKVFSIIYIFAGMGFFLFPLYMYVRYNELVMVMRLQIPGIDPTSEFGFMVTTAYHVVIINTGIAGILAADLAIMMFVLHIIGIVDVFKNALNDLDRLLKDEERDEEVVRRQLFKIFKMHQELIVYEEDLDATYGVAVFVQVITSVACLASTLFIYYVTGNFGSVLFLVAATFQLLEFCLLGTALTVKNGHIELALYDICWHKLSIEDQRMWSFVLFRSQNAVEMTVGGVALLNMETFVEIVRTIYSAFAMMVRFLD